MDIRRMATVSSMIVVTACASMPVHNQQRLAVRTEREGRVIAGVACDLANDRGTWSVRTPGVVAVARDASPLRLRCTRPGLPEARASVDMSRVTDTGLAVIEMGEADARIVARPVPSSIAWKEAFTATTEAPGVRLP